MPRRYDNIGDCDNRRERGGAGPSGRCLFGFFALWSRVNKEELPNKANCEHKPIFFNNLLCVLEAKKMPRSAAKMSPMTRRSRDVRASQTYPVAWISAGGHTLPFRAIGSSPTGSAAFRSSPTEDTLTRSLF